MSNNINVWSNKNEALSSKQGINHVEEEEEKEKEEN
jgi:hypothetical protein